MDLNFLLRCFAILVLAVCVCVRFHNADSQERTGDQAPFQPRYTALAGHFMVPLLLLLLLILEALDGLTGQELRELLGLNAQIFFSASVYSLCLLPLLPWLRRHISARACGCLWLMPGFLYISYYSWSRPARPLLVLRPPQGLLPVLAILWGIGTIAVLAASVVSHLRFRQELLRDAHPVTDEAILSLWRTEENLAGREKRRVALVTSPATATPLAIGLLRRSCRVVLPEKTYAPEDLQLIIRHELIHLSRLDAWNKVYLTVCTALFWWNPLMYLARRRCSEDLELSCDETVLLGANDHTRQRYARLLLNTAGDARGFTTCLSARAEAFRYRLRCITAPGKKALGGMALALALTALLATFGTVALSSRNGTVGDLLLPETADVETVTHITALGQSITQVENPAQVLARIRQLPAETLWGLYEVDSAGQEALDFYVSINGTYHHIDLTAHTLVVHRSHDYSSKELYFLPDPVDFTALLAP